MRNICSIFSKTTCRGLSGSLRWLLFAAVLLSSAAPCAAQIVINEILQNPSAVSDADGEWFELFNPTGSAIDIDGWTVEDNDTDSFVITNGGPLLVPAGGFLVLGNNADPATNGGVAVDFEYPTFFLGNSGDELVLRDTLLAEVDRVEWDNGATFPDPNGASMALLAPGLDNSDGTNWCTAVTPFGSGDLGTPGAANDCPVVVPEVVIHEIMQNPAAVSDAAGEWFELHNPSASAIDIDGFTVADNDSDSFVITNGGPLVIPPGGFLVLGNNADSLTNGGVAVDFEYPSTFFLANGADELVLFDDLLNEVDRVEYDGGPSFPDPNGASMALIDPAFDNNLGESWCTSPNPFGDGDLGTPGAANDCPTVTAESIVVNEILQNPAAVSDGAGEWFELVNPTSDPIDVEGWTVMDNDSDSFVISTGGPLVIPAGGFLVLGNNADFATNGGVNVDFEYPSNFFLANSSDELVLLDAALAEVDRVEWDNGATFPDPNGASMALRNPGFDNNIGQNWCTAETPFGDGDRGTPGAANDCPLPLLNEVDADTPGSDSLEFIELFDGGVGNTPLDGLAVVLYNGNGDVSYAAFDLDGRSTDAEGFFVLGNAGVLPDVTFAGNTLQNGADAVALYAADASDFPNGTALTTSNLIDAVVYDTSDGDDAGLLALLNAGQPQLNEGEQGDKDNHSNQRCPDGAGGGRNTDGFFQDFATPGDFNNCPPLEIFEIQGDGLISPFAGVVISSENNVVTCLAPDGFFMQTPESRSDNVLATSDGIFVFTDTPPSVVVGDLVDVKGEVVEFFGLTEFGGTVSVTVVGNDPNQVPDPVLFDAFVPSPDPAAPSCGDFEFECYESMLIEVAEGTVVASNQEFGSDPFAEVHVVARPGRVFREPGIEFPGLPGLPVWDGNPEAFEMDADRLGLAFDNIPAESTFSARGVLGFEFNHYELWPNELTVDLATLPVPVRAATADELTVGSLNLFRLFDEIDDPPSTNTVGDNRDDAVVLIGDYLRRRAKLASYIVDVLRSPDILAVQEVEKLEVLQALAGDIHDLDPAVTYTAHLIEGNDVGTIDVGFLVRSKIQVNAVTQLGAAELFTFDNPPSALHDRPPLLLEGTADGSFPISVLVVHMRSLGGIDAGPRVPQKRFEQAVSVANMVQNLQNADPDVHLVVTGDFNAFEFSDGFVDLTGIIKGDFVPADSLVCATNACVDLVDPDLFDEVLGIAADERYSFIFRDSFNAAGSRGDAQVLDHALTSAALGALVTGYEYGRGNADAAEELVEDDGTLALLALRSSDHDGLVLYVRQDEDQDGVPDSQDVCLGTSIPEGVPTLFLGPNRFALVDDDGDFDTAPPPGGGGPRGGPQVQVSFTVEDTAGCSCEQIILAQGLGNGHKKFGCSIGAMKNWIKLVSP